MQFSYSGIVKYSAMPIQTRHINKFYYKGAPKGGVDLLYTTAASIVTS